MNEYRYEDYRNQQGVSTKEGAVNTFLNSQGASTLYPGKRSAGTWYHRNTIDRDMKYRYSCLARISNDERSSGKMDTDVTCGQKKLLTDRRSSVVS